MAVVKRGGGELPRQTGDLSAGPACPATRRRLCRSKKKVAIALSRQMYGVVQSKAVGERAPGKGVGGKLGPSAHFGRWRSWGRHERQSSVFERAQGRECQGGVWLGERMWFVLGGRWGHIRIRFE